MSAFSAISTLDIGLEVAVILSRCGRTIRGGWTSIHFFLGVEEYPAIFGLVSGFLATLTICGSRSVTLFLLTLGLRVSVPFAIIALYDGWTCATA